MGPRTGNEYPQVIAAAKASRSGTVTLKKRVRDHLGGGDDLYLVTEPEVLLTARKASGELPAELKGSRLQLPEDVQARLGLDGNSLVAMIQRPGAVAIKRLSIEEHPSDNAQAVDVETPYVLRRIIRTNPMPEDLLPLLQAQHSDLGLRYDVRKYLQGRETLAAWRGRQLIGAAHDGDDRLREYLVQARLDAQGEDGSWEGSVPVTARTLRELAHLGLTREDRAVGRGVEWLLRRPQSAHNPGMFFAADELVAEQAQVVEGRQRAKREKTSGSRGRFRQLKASEKKRVMAGDDMIVMPCGPRIMWPNALVLETLLLLGYEGHERVQAALAFMTTHDWCECGYQHGKSDWRSSEPQTEEQIEAFEARCVRQFRYGGFPDTRALVEWEPARVNHTTTAEGEEYALRMPDHIQGCEFITTRAVSRVGEVRMQRFARAHLWRFAGIQHDPDGAFPREHYGTGFGQAGILEAMARYDHPASKTAVMRALPWIIEAQNGDGSWGEEPRQDASTLAVLLALDSVRDLLPAGLWP